MYLEPQNGKEPMFKAAVRLLHNHGESLDPLQVLEVRDLKVHMLMKLIMLLYNSVCFMDTCLIVLISFFFFQKLSPDMPLKLASDTILRMLRARVHHHRQGQVNNSQIPFLKKYPRIMLCGYYFCECPELLCVLLSNVSHISKSNMYSYILRRSHQ